MPNVMLPKNLDGFADDAKEHIRRGIVLHEKLFGKKPKGMWPSEGSVCQAMIPFLADAGINWIATDEEILSCTTDGWISRDSNGYLRNPEMLYRPWRAEELGKAVQIVFRDHAMSDQIGFHYQRFSHENAVNDFIGKIEAIGNATDRNAGHRPTMVNIILDGENCWEYYPNNGIDFLRGLYRRVVQHPRIQPVRVNDYLTKYPATDKLGNLFPGSWIQHNFGIWIGHPECNNAWDLLFETRRYLADVTAKKNKPPEKIARAWEELYIAEGSDWFWWFGDSHTSAQDLLFDRLFRKHLQNVYIVLDETPPAELAKPISQGQRHPRVYTDPTGLSRVKVDGRQTYFEWINAGHYVCGGSRGTMNMVATGILSHVYFGFDLERLLLRFDALGGPVREQLTKIDALRVCFLSPENYVVSLRNPSHKKPVVGLLHNDLVVTEIGMEAAADSILELAIPFSQPGIENRRSNPVLYIADQ